MTETTPGGAPPPPGPPPGDAPAAAPVPASAGGFGDHVQMAFEIVKLNPEVIVRVSRNEQAFQMGLLIVAASGLTLALGSLNPMALIVGPLIHVVGSFLFVGFVFLLARLFGGKGDFLPLYRTLSHAYLADCVNIIPFVGPLIGFGAFLWRLVVTVVTLEKVMELERGKAVGVVLIILAIALVLGLLCFFLLFATFAAVIGAASQAHGS